MQEKRPRTSMLSFSMDANNHKIITTQQEQGSFPSIADKMKKWQEIAKEFNHEIFLSTNARRGRSAHQPLQKMGGKSFQLKQMPTQTTNTVHMSRPATSTKQLMKPKTSTAFQRYRNSQKNKPTLKRNSRQYVDNKSNVQYDRMVLKIGSNMQYEQKFNMFYIENIRKVQIIQPTPMPIVYGIKSDTQTYHACMTSFQNEQMPICISLFTESFHAKYQQSIKKKKTYLDNMIKAMNGTYDPEIMSRMPIINKKKGLDIKQYYAVLPKFKVSICHEQKQLLQKLMQKIKTEKLPKYEKKYLQLARLQKQAIQSYKQALAIANLDYYLKDPQNLAHLPLRQYLSSQKEYISSFRICYHGGYSKFLYSGWNNYYKHGQTELPKKVFKLSEKVQIVNGWIQIFSPLLFIEDQLFNVLLAPVSIDQMSTIQQIKIADSFNIFRNLCIKGVLTILAYNRYLLIQQNQHQQITTSTTKYQYLQAKHNNNRSIHSIYLNSQNQLTNWYQQHLRTRHTQKILTNITDLTEVSISRKQQLPQLEHKQVNKSINILVNIFYEQLITRSIDKFIDFFMYSTKPYIKLNLIVDRQSLKLQQPEENITHSFTSIFHKLTREYFHCNSVGLKMEDPKSTEYQEYGNLVLTDIQSLTSRSSFAWTVKVQYKGMEIQDRRINQFLARVRDWYHEAQGVIQHFGCFMPFIKLTAKEKIFSQDMEQLEGLSQWEQAKQLYLNNRDKVLIYKNKLAATPKKFAIGIFEVDCSQPQAILRDRISQLEYLFQQKYLSKVFGKIHEMQQELGKILSLIHSFNIKVNRVEEITEQLQKSKKQLHEIKHRTKQLASHIYFFIDKAKSTILINRFAQLINKRCELLVQIQQLKIRIKQDSLELQCKRSEQRILFRNKIVSYGDKLADFCRQYFEINKWDKYRVLLNNMQNQLVQFHTEFNQLKDPNCYYEQEQQLYTTISNRIYIVYSYWLNVNNFNLVVKEFDLQKIREIDVERYEQIVEASLGTISAFQQLKIQVNQINFAHLARFKQEVNKHKSCLQSIKILANKQISLEYYTNFDCILLLNIPFRDLLNLPNWPTYKPILKRLDYKAKAEQQMYARYCQIHRKFESQKLTIIDLHGCDTLDPDLTNELAETLRQEQFQCERLLLSEHSHKYRGKIEELWDMMIKCEKIVIKWLQVENKYIELEAYYKYNDDGYFKQSFKRIADCHRKIIKSFDMDNSVVLLPTNSFLLTSLDTLLEKMRVLKKDLYRKFNQLQSTTCRLQLLTHDELLQMMSFVTTIPKHLPKCLPSISNIALCEQAIERVGGYTVNQQSSQTQAIFGNYIELKEPINLGQRLANISIWLQKLLNEIKFVMKNEFVQSDRKQSCLQILQLKEQLYFTEDVEQILSSEEDQTRKLQMSLESLQRRIEQKAKNSTQRYNTQMLLLLLMMERDILSSLIQNQQAPLTKDSFEWIKNARFYNLHPHSPKKVNKFDLNIKMQIIGESYPYNFMFIEKCEMIVQDVLFVGNCIVGQKGIGKKAIVKHYAYMTGNQLFVFERDRISANFIENVVNYYKLAITTGSWLLIPQVDSMSSEEMRIIGQCFNYLNHAIQSKSPKMEIFVYNQFVVNSNCKVFFTLQDFNCIPTRLAHNFRPIWLCAPSLEFIGSVCNEAANMVDNKLVKKVPNGENINFTFKIIDFIHWNHIHEDIPLYLAQSMLEQFEKPTKPCQHYLQNNFLNLLIHNKFLLPEDIGPPFLIEDNIQWILESCAFSIFYMPTKDFINFVSNNFNEDTYVVLALKSRDFGKMRQSFNFLRRRIRKSQVKYLFLQQSLDNYRMIEGEMKDEVIKQKNIKVIFLQSIKNLQKQAGIRIQAHFPTVIIPAPKPKSANNQNMPKFKKIGFKSVCLNQQENLELDAVCKKIVGNIVESYLKNKVPSQQIAEVLRWFNKLYTRLVQSKYCREVSFIFSMGWVFGNVVSQKNLIAQLNKFPNEFKCKKYLKYCTNLRELFPNKHELISGCNLIEQKHSIQYNEGQLSFKSIIFSNLKLIRQILYDEAVSISSESAIDQIVQTILPSCFHLYPIDLTSPIVLKNILEHILKIETSQKFPRFVVHFAERLSQEVLFSVNRFIEKGEVIYIQGDDLKSFNQRKCQFTLTSSSKISSYNMFKIEILKEDIMEIEINKLEGIKQSKNLLPFDEPILKGLISYYRTNSNKVFWFQIPIRQVFKRCGRKRVMSSFFLQLLRYELLALPNDKNKILNEISYCASSVSFLKSDSTQYQIKMNNAAQILNPIEEALLEAEIEARKNICKDIVVMNENFSPTPYWYEMIYKTYIAVSGSHTILIGSTFTQRYYCLQIAARILNIEIIPWNYETIREEAQECPMKKNILYISEKNIREGALTQLQSLISKESSSINISYYVVIKFDEQAPETENIYKTYPFLRKYFIHVNFLKNSKQDITKCINLVKTLKNLENGSNKHELSVLNDEDIPPELEVEKSITQYFQVELNKNIGFLMGLLEFRRQIEVKQFNKYRFYRNLTEQLFHSISLMGKQVENFPNKLEILENKYQQLNKEKNEVKLKKDELLQFIENLKNQLNLLNESIREKTQNAQKLKQKVSTYEKQSQVNFKKICNKIDSMGVQQHTKFKQNLESEVSNQIYNMIANLIKWQPGKLKKVPVAKLETLSKDKSFKWQKYRENIRKILATWKNAKKKNEKIGILYLALIQWIEAIDNYYFKNVEEYQKLRITASNIQKEIQSQNGQVQALKQILIQKQEQVSQFEQFIAQKQLSEKQLKQFMELMGVRQERIQIVLKTIAEKQHKIKISKDLAERLYFLPKIIMSKSINRMALNQYEDDYYIGRQLFLRSTRQDESKQITDVDLFKYDLPLFQNIFDDFEPVLEVYTKYNLVDLDYDQVKLIQTVIASKQRVQIIEDTHDLITKILLEIFGNYLGYKELNLTNACLTNMKKQIMQKAKSYNKIIIRMSRSGKQIEVVKLIEIIIEAISGQQNLKIIVIFKRFDSLYQTDRFREISDRKVILTYRKYLKQYAKIVHETEISNEWELYQVFNLYNKLHKSLFEQIQKFQPESDESFNRILEVVKNFDDARDKKQKAFEIYDQYYQNLSAISLQFGPYYIFLKYIQGIDRLNPIQLFQEGNLLKNYQQVLKKVSAQMYGQEKNTKSSEILQKFIIYFSNLINFTDEEQVNQYCMIAAFLLLKPQKISPYMIIKILRKADKFTKPSERVQCIMKQVTHNTVNLKAIQKMLGSKNLQQICEPWLEYLIFATSSNYQFYFESFLHKISETEIQQIVNSIRTRSYSLDSHYYLSKTKLDFKNEFKMTTCRQRACKFFWLIKVKKDHVQKFMEVLENRVNILKEGIKLVTFFFNQSKREANFERLVELSERKIFICIFNISKEKNYLIDEIISYLQQKSKNINQLFKLFFLTQDSTLIKNRQHIDYISFIPSSQQACEQTFQKNAQNLTRNALKNVENSQNIQRNLNIINSLQVIVEKCTNKMQICREKDKIHKFVLSQLLNPVVLGKDQNAIKFIAEYFRFSKYSADQILEFCKLKQPLLVFNNKQAKTNKIEIEPNSDTLVKWVRLFQKLQQCKILQPNYKQILKEQVQSVIQNLIKGEPARIIINQFEIKNITKYGWVKIQNPDTLKFLLYKGVHRFLRNQPQEYNCEIISELKLVCCAEDKTIQFNFSEFNTLFSAENIVKQIELKIRIIEENNDDPLLDRTEIQYILEHFNMRVSLLEEKDALGKLYLTFK